MLQTSAAGNVMVMQPASYRFGNSVVEALQLCERGRFPTEHELYVLEDFLTGVTWYSDRDESLTIENDIEDEDRAFVNAEPGDFIIKENGTFSVRDAESFKRMYQPVVN